MSALDHFRVNTLKGAYYGSNFSIVKDAWTDEEYVESWWRFVNYFFLAAIYSLQAYVFSRAVDMMPIS